jgi:signal peptidase I
MRTKLLFACLVCAIVGLSIGKLFVYDLTTIRSTDMAPSLMPGDLLLVNKLSPAPRRGQLVLFEHPSASHLLIRRVVALPGESFALSDEIPVVDGTRAKRALLGDATLQMGRGNGQKEQTIRVRVVEESIGRVSYRVLKDPQRRSKDLVPNATGDGYYLLSDNRNHGSDSRDFGRVAAGRIRAVVTHRLSGGESAIAPSAKRPEIKRFPW